MKSCYRNYIPYSMYQTKIMLCWVMCWLHGHVVCDGSLMVGIWGRLVGGNGRGDGAGDHTSVTIVLTLTQHKAFQSRDGWGQCCS